MFVGLVKRLFVLDSFKAILVDLKESNILSCDLQIHLIQFLRLSCLYFVILRGSFKLYSRDFHLASLENVPFDASSANRCNSLFDLFILKSNSCLIFKYFFDLLEVRCIKESVVLVQVVLVREGTFKWAYEAEHADGVTFNTFLIWAFALADIWKILPASLNVIFCEVLSFLLFNTIRSEWMSSAF